MTAALIIAAAVLSADVARVRVYHSDKPIQRIVRNLAVGGAVRNVDRIDVEDIRRLLAEEHPALDLPHVSFWRNGQPIEAKNPLLWLTAAAIQQHRSDSSISYAYRVNLRGINVHRQTFARVGYVRLTSRITGDLGRVSRAVSTIEATERNGRTTIRHTLWVRVPLRCRLVNRIARRRVIPPLVDDALARAERRALTVSAAGEGATLRDLGAAVAESIRGGLRQRSTR